MGSEKGMHPVVSVVCNFPDCPFILSHHSESEHPKTSGKVSKKILGHGYPKKAKSKSRG